MICPRLGLVLSSHGVICPRLGFGVTPRLTTTADALSSPPFRESGFIFSLQRSQWARTQPSLLAASSRLRLGSEACALHPLSPVLFPPASTRSDPPNGREFEFLPFLLVKSFPWVPLAPILSLNRFEAARSRPCHPQMLPTSPPPTPGHPTMAQFPSHFLKIFYVFIILFIKSWLMFPSNTFDSIK